MKTAQNKVLRSEARAILRNKWNTSVNSSETGRSTTHLYHKIIQIFITDILLKWVYCIYIFPNSSFKIKATAEKKKTFSPAEYNDSPIKNFAFYQKKLRVAQLNTIMIKLTVKDVEITSDFKKYKIKKPLSTEREILATDHGSDIHVCQ